MKTYLEKARLLFQIRKMSGLKLWRAPRGIDFEDAVEHLVGAAFILLFPVIWVLAFILSPLSPFWWAFSYDLSRIKKSHAKWSEIDTEDSAAATI